MRQEGNQVDTIQFPNRTTGIGSILDDYLSMKSEVHDKVRTFLYVILKWYNPFGSYNFLNTVCRLNSCGLEKWGRSHNIQMSSTCSPWLSLFKIALKKNHSSLKFFCRRSRLIYPHITRDCLVLFHCNINQIIDTVYCAECWVESDWPWQIIENLSLKP